MQRICHRILVIGLLALASGPLYAQKAPSPKITGADIADGTITSADIATSTINTSDVAPNGLTGASIDERTLVGVDADTIDGVDSSELSRSKSYAFTRFTSCQGSPDCFQELSVANDAWPFEIKLICSKPTGSTVRVAADFFGQGWATTPPGPGEATVNSGDLGYMTYVRHVIGPAIVLNGVSTETMARIEIRGVVFDTELCAWSGAVEIIPTF